MSVRRVLLVPSAYLPNLGGIEEVTRRLALGLRERGVETAVLTSRWPASTPLCEELDGVRVERVDFHLPAARAPNLLRFAALAPLSARRVVAIVRELRPELIHVIGAGPNAAYVAALRRLLRVPIVLGTHGELSGDAHDGFQRSATLRRSLGALARTAAAVTAPSAYTLEELRRAYAVHGPSEVIPNGVDVAELAGASPRTGLGRYVLTVGRLVPQKGFDVLLDAVARVGGCRLVVAGDGPERGRLEAEISRRGLGESVLLLGAVPRGELPGLYAGAEAVVLASRKEAFGLVALEAMAAGAPLVATAVGGLPEFARDGETALLVPPDDPQAIADALLRLLGDDELQRRLVRNGLDEAAGRSWDSVVERYVEFYRRVGG